MINKNNKRGYSIVELLVYLSIFTMVSIVVINSYLVILSSFRETKTNRDLQESGSTVIERMSREIRQAKSIDIINSSFNVSSGLLSLSSTDGSGNAQVVKFKLEADKKINLYQNSLLIDNLLSQNIVANSLVFRRISTTQGEAVKIEMTLQDIRSKDNKTANFYDTIILRGGY